MKFHVKCKDEVFARSVLLLKILSYQDLLTAQHSINVAFIMKVITTELVDIGMDKDDCFYASLLHDIGKILMPKFIFTDYIVKTEEDFNQIKNHPRYSRDILKKQDFEEDIIQMVFSHHERCDGSGYPRGISDADISKAAKLLAIVDSFCAITEDRPYRKAKNVEDAVKIISSSIGQYDSELLFTLINNVDYILDKAKYQINEFGKRFPMFFSTPPKEYTAKGGEYDTPLINSFLTI